MNKEYIRSAMEKNLSGLCMQGDMRAAVWNSIQGGKKVKKKISAALVLAIILMLATVTALAVSNWEAVKDYLSQVSKLDRETKGWPLEDRLRLVELMHEAGIPMDEEAYRRLQSGAVSEQEKTALSDRIIEARYGSDWQWNANDVIAQSEWPVEMRYQSLESAIEYEQWLDAQRKTDEVQGIGADAEYHLMREEDIIALFRDYLENSLGFEKESLARMKIQVSHDESARVWQAGCLLTKEEPGWHLPTQGDQMSRRTEESTMFDYIQAYLTEDMLKERLQDREEIPLVLSVDDWGRDTRFRCTDMEEYAFCGMLSELTEIKNFTYASVEPDRIRVSHSPEGGLWTASYIVDAAHPGAYNRMPDEQGPDTVYEYLCEWEGAQESFTITWQCTDWMRPVDEHPLPPAAPPQVSRREALSAAKEALMAKYGCTEEALDAMRQDVSDWDTDGAAEYYIEFVGYDYFSANYARLFNYAARVDKETGRVVAAVSREDWEPMTDRRLVVDDSNRERVEQDRKDRALRLAAGETGNELTDRHLYYDEQYVPFEDWDLNAKAAYSQTVKPRIDAFLAAHGEDLAYYLDAEKDNWYTITACYIATTRHAYGLPDEGALAEEDAFRLACAALSDAYDVPREIIENGKKSVYYDVTSPGRPLWKFCVDVRNAGLGEDAPWAVFAALDARTGEVIVTHFKPVNPEEGLRMSDFM